MLIRKAITTCVRRKMQHSELTEKIIACACVVYNRMGFGYLESVYERCVLIELADIGLRTTLSAPTKMSA